MRHMHKAIVLFEILLMALSLSPLNANSVSLKTLVENNSAFAVDPYQTLRTVNDNLFFSPILNQQPSPYRYGIGNLKLANSAMKNEIKEARSQPQSATIVEATSRGF